MLFVENGGNTLKASCVSGEKGREKERKETEKRREGGRQGDRGEGKRKKGREMCVQVIIK